MYNEVFPCIFEPKSKVPVESRSVYQFSGDILKFKATEKTHATLRSKKRFPMFIDHIYFLTRRAGWKVNNVHHYYTFEKEHFKKDYILGNQKVYKLQWRGVTTCKQISGNFLITLISVLTTGTICTIKAST